MKKQIIISFVSGAVMFGAIGAFAGQYVATENPFPIQLNGSDVSIEGYNIDGSTYFKLRDIADTIGGFDVGFENNTIQLAKDGYVYENNTAPSFEVTGEMITTLADYAMRIPQFTQADLATTEFTDNFIFYFYTGKPTDSEYHDNDLFYGTPENEVREQFKLLFGQDMPYTTNNLRAGYYWIHVSNFGDTMYVYQSTEKTAEGANVLFNRVSGDGDFFGTTTLHLAAADNANGYIITAID